MNINKDRFEKWKAKKDIYYGDEEYHIKKGDICSYDKALDMLYSPNGQCLMFGSGFSGCFDKII